MESYNTTETYRYRDEENDKFFEISYGFNGAKVAYNMLGEVTSKRYQVVYNQGKTGTFGRHKFNFYETESESLTEVKKLVDARIKQGYTRCDNMYIDERGRRRFDDGEVSEINEQPSEVVHATYFYRDEKSDKFWRYEYVDNVLLINYGKTGSIGRFKLTEFDDDEACEKKVNALVKSKMKKGYKLDDAFDMNTCIYAITNEEDEEVGFHLLTSHPKFRKHFTDDFYYDCTDEEAPFGSDEGWDTFYLIVDEVRQNKAFNFIEQLPEIVSYDGSMTYYPPTDLTYEVVEKLLKEDEMHLTNSDMAVYATAFSQIKITGRIDSELKELALNAMKRKLITDKILGYDEDSTVLTKMISDLDSFFNYRRN